jgi:transcriptional regulator of acetoin/glycerol metabolism
VQQAIISELNNYTPERIWLARRTFFEQGGAPVGLVDDPVLRSWQRCREQGRGAADQVAFDPVNRVALSRLLDGQRSLLALARPELETLARAVSDAGYAVLLTDAKGRALAVEGRMDRRSAPLRQAFRPGVDLSEAMIGTNAMSSAISEKRVVRVLGAEHFFADNQIFHCCAAPVFDPQGLVIGAVDISRDMPGLVAGAQALTQRCARRIERKLFEALPAFVRLRLETQDENEEAWLAFNRDGGLLAANVAARQLMDVPCVPTNLGFTDLFDGRFDAIATAASQAGGELNLRLHGGVLLHARASGLPDTARVMTTPQRAVQQSSSRARPDLGDTTFAADFERALRAFNADLPVLISGETGAGKEVAARALHQASQRREGPLMAINCGAIAPQLMAAELFGHVEGAFTGATRGGSMGKIEAAQGGTLLLDEIGDMPLELQVGLLRVLDSGELVRVGATRAARVDVRFICATHRDLRARVAAGSFREDLYYRISGFQLQVPPLRQRNDFNAVLNSLLAEQGCTPQHLDAGLRQALASRPWPGNVRQLRHALKLALALLDAGEVLTLAHFPSEPIASTASITALPATLAHAADDALNWKQTQQQAIDAALQRTGGNVTAAAALLGMGRATLYRKLTHP